MSNQVNIGRNDRVCFFGRTGCGKTTLARALLHATNLPYVVLDPKHRYRDGEVPITDWFEPKLPEQIIRVDASGGPEELEAWNQVIHEVWLKEGRIIYADELTLITPPRSVLPALGRALRTGRERGIATWMASQRPKDIPSVVFTESEHFFCFKLQWTADRDKVSSFTTEQMFDAYERLHSGGAETKHDFMYYGVENDQFLRVKATNTA